MGLRGPKTQPTALKILKGNPGKGALPKDEPQAGGFTAEPPEYLGEAGRAEWCRLVPMLKRMGVLGDVDYVAVGHLLRAFEIWVQAQDGIREHGILIVAPNGYLVQNPALSIARKQSEVMLKLLPQFGMTASGRTGLHVQKDKSKDNPFAAIGNCG